MSRRARPLGLALLLLAFGAGAEPAAAPDVAARGPSIEERLAEIQRRVQAGAHYPESARARGVHGEARMGFAVSPDGRAEDVELLASSGSLALDRAAERAVREARALPRVVGRVAIPVRFALRPSD
ncbi:MAG: energy transducer TonB [Myxococcota bacterium]